MRDEEEDDEIYYLGQRQRDEAEGHWRNESDNYFRGQSSSSNSSRRSSGNLQDTFSATYIPCVECDGIYPGEKFLLRHMEQQSNCGRDILNCVDLMKKRCKKCLQKISQPNPNVNHLYALLSHVKNCRGVEHRRMDSRNSGCRWEGYHNRRHHSTASREDDSETAHGSDSHGPNNDTNNEHFGSSQSEELRQSWSPVENSSNYRTNYDERLTSRTLQSSSEVLFNNFKITPNPVSAYRRFRSVSTISLESAESSGLVAVDYSVDNNRSGRHFTSANFENKEENSSSVKIFEPVVHDVDDDSSDSDDCLVIDHDPDISIIDYNHTDKPNSPSPNSSGSELNLQKQNHNANLINDKRVESTGFNSTTETPKESPVLVMQENDNNISKINPMTSNLLTVNNLMGISYDNNNGPILGLGRSGQLITRLQVPMPTDNMDNRSVGVQVQSVGSNNPPASRITSSNEPNLPGELQIEIPDNGTISLETITGYYKRCDFCALSFGRVTEGIEHFLINHKQKRCPECLTIINLMDNNFLDHLKVNHFQFLEDKINEWIPCKFCGERHHYEILWGHITEKHLEHIVVNPPSTITTPRQENVAMPPPSPIKTGYTETENNLNSSDASSERIKSEDDIEIGQGKRHFSQAELKVMIPYFVKNPNTPWSDRAREISETLKIEQCRIESWLSNNRTLFKKGKHPLWAVKNGKPLYDVHFSNNKMQLIKLEQKPVDIDRVEAEKVEEKQGKNEETVQKRPKLVGLSESESEEPGGSRRRSSRSTTKAKRSRSHSSNDLPYRLRVLKKPVNYTEEDEQERVGRLHRKLLRRIDGISSDDSSSDESEPSISSPVKVISRKRKSAGNGASQGRKRIIVESDESDGDEDEIQEMKVTKTKRSGERTWKEYRKIKTIDSNNSDESDEDEESNSSNERNMNSSAEGSNKVAGVTKLSTSSTSNDNPVALPYSHIQIRKSQATFLGRESSHANKKEKDQNCRKNTEKSKNDKERGGASTSKESRKNYEKDPVKSSVQFNSRDCQEKSKVSSETTRKRRRTHSSSTEKGKESLFENGNSSNCNSTSKQPHVSLDDDMPTAKVVEEVNEKLTRLEEKLQKNNTYYSQLVDEVRTCKMTLMNIKSSNNSIPSSQITGISVNPIENSAICDPRNSLITSETPQNHGSLKSPGDSDTFQSQGLSMKASQTAPNGVSNAYKSQESTLKPDENPNLQISTPEAGENQKSDGNTSKQDETPKIQGSTPVAGKKSTSDGNTSTQDENPNIQGSIEASENPKSDGNPPTYDENPKIQESAPKPGETTNSNKNSSKPCENVVVQDSSRTPKPCENRRIQGSTHETSQNSGIQENSPKPSENPKAQSSAGTPKPCENPKIQNTSKYTESPKIQGSVSKQCETPEIRGSTKPNESSKCHARDNSNNPVIFIKLSDSFKNHGIIMKTNESSKSQARDSSKSREVSIKLSGNSKHHGTSEKKREKSKVHASDNSKSRRTSIKTSKSHDANPVKRKDISSSSQRSSLKAVNTSQSDGNSIAAIDSSQSDESSIATVDSSQSHASSIRPKGNSKSHENATKSRDMPSKRHECSTKARANYKGQEINTKDSDTCVGQGSSISHTSKIARSCTKSSDTSSQLSVKTKRNDASSSHGSCAKTTNVVKISPAATTGSESPQSYRLVRELCRSAQAVLNSRRESSSSSEPAADVAKELKETVTSQSNKGIEPVALPLQSGNVPMLQLKMDDRKESIYKPEIPTNILQLPSHNEIKETVKEEKKEIVISNCTKAMGVPAPPNVQHEFGNPPRSLRADISSRWDVAFGNQAMYRNPSPPRKSNALLPTPTALTQNNRFEEQDYDRNKRGRGSGQSDTRGRGYASNLGSERYFAKHGKNANPYSWKKDSKWSKFPRGRGRGRFDTKRGNSRSSYYEKRSQYREENFGSRNRNRYFKEKESYLKQETWNSSYGSEKDYPPSTSYERRNYDDYYERDKQNIMDNCRREPLNYSNNGNPNWNSQTDHPNNHPRNINQDFTTDFSSPNNYPENYFRFRNWTSEENLRNNNANGNPKRSSQDNTQDNSCGNGNSQEIPQSQNSQNRDSTWDTVENPPENNYRITQFGNWDSDERPGCSKDSDEQQLFTRRTLPNVGGKKNEDLFSRRTLPNVCGKGNEDLFSRRSLLNDRNVDEDNDLQQTSKQHSSEHKIIFEVKFSQNFTRRPLNNSSQNVAQDSSSQKNLSNKNDKHTNKEGNPSAKDLQKQQKEFGNSANREQNNVGTEKDNSQLQHSQRNASEGMSLILMNYGLENKGSSPTKKSPATTSSSSNSPHDPMRTPSVSPQKGNVSYKQRHDSISKVSRKELATQFQKSKRFLDKLQELFFSRDNENQRKVIHQTNLLYPLVERQIAFKDDQRQFIDECLINDKNYKTEYVQKKNFKTDIARHWSPVLVYAENFHISVDEAVKDFISATKNMQLSIKELPSPEVINTMLGV